MGRIKSLMIKRAAFQLYDEVGEFTEDFERNKKLLKGTMPSKSVRNKVAGSLVSLAKKQRQKENDKRIKREQVENGEQEN